MGNAAAGRILSRTRLAGNPHTSGHSDAMSMSCRRLSMKSPKNPSRSPRTNHGIFIWNRLKPHVLALAAGEGAALLVTHLPGQSDGFLEVQTDFFRRMGVGAKGNRHAGLMCQLEDSRTGIN